MLLFFFKLKNIVHEPWLNDENMEVIGIGKIIKSGHLNNEEKVICLNYFENIKILFKMEIKNFVSEVKLHTT